MRNIENYKNSYEFEENNEVPQQWQIGGKENVGKVPKVGSDGIIRLATGGGGGSTTTISENQQQLLDTFAGSIDVDGTTMNISKVKAIDYDPHNKALKGVELNGNNYCISAELESAYVDDTYVNIYGTGGFALVVGKTESGSGTTNYYDIQPKLRVGSNITLGEITQDETTNQWYQEISATGGSGSDVVEITIPFTSQTEGSGTITQEQFNKIKTAKCPICVSITSSDVVVYKFDVGHYWFNESRNEVAGNVILNVGFASSNYSMANFQIDGTNLTTRFELVDFRYNYWTEYDKGYTWSVSQTFSDGIGVKGTATIENISFSGDLTADEDADVDFSKADSVDLGNGCSANPTLAGTETSLTSIKINGTDYKIDSGSSISTYIKDITTSDNKTYTATKQDGTTTISWTLPDTSSFITKEQSDAAYVAKSTATSGVTAYVRDSGSESNMSVAQVATANSIARRAGNGVLSVGEPTADSHAATKKYVDDNKGTVVSGTNDGTNWTDITIAGTKMNIPTGGSSTPYLELTGTTGSLTSEQWTTLTGSQVAYIILDNNKYYYCGRTYDTTTTTLVRTLTYVCDNVGKIVITCNDPVSPATEYTYSWEWESNGLYQHNINILYRNTSATTTSQIKECNFIITLFTNSPTKINRSALQTALSNYETTFLLSCYDPNASGTIYEPTLGDDTHFILSSIVNDPQAGFGLDSSLYVQYQYLSGGSLTSSACELPYSEISDTSKFININDWVLQLR